MNKKDLSKKPLRFLAVETSQDYLGICLGEKRPLKSLKVVARFYRSARNKHSDWLVPKADGLLKKLGWTPRDLTAMAVDIGPGSFTGVRIGLTMARMLAQSLDIPLIGVPSLDLLAAGCSLAQEGSVVASLVKAIPGEVYLGVYVAETPRKGRQGFPSKSGFSGLPSFPGSQGLVLRRLAPLAWLDWKEASRRLKHFESLGKSIVRVGRSWEPGTPGLEEAPRPEVLLSLAAWVWERGGGQLYRHVVPLYLQPSWAERRIEPASVSERLRVSV